MVKGALYERFSQEEVWDSAGDDMESEVKMNHYQNSQISECVEACICIVFSPSHANMHA